MVKHIQLLKRVLIAELEDCLEDVVMLSCLYQKRLQGNEIGEYVNKENQEVLARESNGVKHIISLVSDMNPVEYDSIDAFSDGIERIIRQEVVEYDDPGVVLEVAERKVKKVLRYVREQSELS